MLNHKNNTVECLVGVFQVNRIKYVLLLLMAFVMPAMAAVNMTGVEFNSLPGDLVELKFRFDGKAPDPKVYTIESPARIALDLEGVSSKLRQKKHTLDLGNTQSVNVVEAGGRTRVIVNLQQLTQHTSRIEGNELIVSVGGGNTTKEYLKGTSSQLEKSAMSDAISAISSIDFRRGENGEGRLIVELTNPNVDVNTYVEGKLIKLAFNNTQMPEALRLRYDVSDFATPVQWVKAHDSATSALLDISPTGEYDYLAYQTQNTYVLTVKPLTKAEVEAKKKEFAYVGDKLSLNFQDIEVRSVLQLIADFTGLNLVASDTVGGSITLRLQNVPWDQALDLILKTKGLDKRQIGNVLLVAPAEEIAAREKLELETNKQIAELAPVRLDIIQVNYAKAADIVSLIQADAELISSRGFVSSDARTNTISVRETSEKLEEIRRLVSTWDVPVRQVSVEARIVRAQTNVSQDLGVRWGAEGRATVDGGTDRIVVGGSRGGVAGVDNFGLGLPSDLNVDLGVNNASSSIAFGYIGTDVLLDLELSAFESDGQIEIVSQPRVVTADRQSARIKSGQEVPYQEATSSGATSTEFKEATLSLEVTPQITPDNKVIMDVVVTQDSIGEDTSNGPAINTNEVTTQILVADGETVVLGGIFESTNARTVTKTPFFLSALYMFWNMLSVHNSG